MLDDAKIQHHATVVAWAGSGVMIIGKPGSGKTSLALHLMALGCDLVADDRTELYKQGDQLVARCPLAIQGQIEARGFGILQTPFIVNAVIVCVVDLDQTEQKRLPEHKTTTLCGVTLPFFHKADIGVLPFALLQYLKGSKLLRV